MFEAEILHAEDMLERLEGELNFSYAERQYLPPHKRVPTAEYKQWAETVQNKIAALSDEGANKRYQILNEEMQRFDGKIPENYLIKSIEYIHGIVRLLRQLDRLHPRVNHEAIVSRPDRSPTTNAVIHYDVFISHASEDKDAAARPLYDALIAAGLTVWYDSAVLELGDSLRRKIDEGLRQCSYGVVILSPSFLDKDWPQRELDGLVARETNSGEKAILPVLHNLTPVQLARRSPMLADRLAAQSTEGISSVADQILRVVLRSRRDA